MTEAALTREIQAALTDKDTRLWRNNCGVLIDSRGQHVAYGLAVGSSDLIGLRSVVILPEHIGSTLAVFCAVEVKLPGVRARPEHQRNYIDQVLRMGGRAGFASSVGEAGGVLSGTSP